MNPPSSPAAVESQAVSGQPSAESGEPTADSLCELDTVKIDPAPPPVYVVIGRQKCGCGGPTCSGWVGRERKVLTLTEAQQYAEQLARAGFRVDVYRAPGPKKTGPIKEGRYPAEPLVGYRPALLGVKAIGVG